jgi:hypothetical protein
LGVVIVAAMLAAPTAIAGPALTNPCSLANAAQVAPILGGKPTGHALRTVGKGRTCIWLGPKAGYTQSTLYISVSQMTKSQFLANESKSGAQRVGGVGSPAFQDQLEFLVWKKNTLIVLINPNLAFEPSKAVALARAALTNL